MMFRFFKRTKIESWETEFLKTFFLKLPDKAGAEFHRQVELGLLKSVVIEKGVIPNYVSFTYNPSLSNKFYNAKGEHYKYSNIQIENVYTGKLLSVSIYIAYGMILGYAIENDVPKYKFNNATIDLNSIKKVVINSGSNAKILALLTTQEQQLINENDIYLTTLDNKDYYHLKELEDGDFIGIDYRNNIYIITHHPLKVSAIARNKLPELLK